MPADRDCYLEMAREWLRDRYFSGVEVPDLTEDARPIAALLRDVAAEARREALEEAASMVETDHDFRLLASRIRGLKEER